MDYFSVIILVIVAFVFISDRNIKSIDQIKQEKYGENLEQEINSIKQEMKILKINTNDFKYKKILSNIPSLEKTYILIQNSEINLDEKQIDIIIANYINSGENPCGINLMYTYKENKWSFKRLYLDIINYLNIFNKKEISSYGIIVCKTSDVKLDKNELENKMVSYNPNDITDIEYNSEDINASKLKNIYLEKISKANLEMIVKIILLIISGSIITTNLIHNFFNITNNINGLIISLVIYYCYSYIIRYIYKSLRKNRVIATYIFPIYFITYIFVVIYTIFSKVIKKVQAS